MNFKVYLIIVTALSLSACGHLRSDSTSEPSPSPRLIINSTEGAAKNTNSDDTVTGNTTPASPIDTSKADTQNKNEASATTLETIPLANSSVAPAINILERIRQGFRFPDLQSKYIKEYERWDATHPTYLRNLFVRAEPFLYYIVEEIEKRGLPMELALLPAIESAYKPNAVSKSKAAGLWQFIPSTGRGFGLHQNWWYDGRRDVIASTQAALDYLTQLNKMFDGDWFLTLAAYNAGPGTISRAIKNNKRKRKGTAYTDLRLRSETRRYVPKLIALKNIINNPRQYNFELPALANEVHFQVIELPGQTDIHRFASNAKIDHNVIKHLNPGFKRWATPPQGPHRLLVPAINSHAAHAAKRIAQNSPKTEYRNHTIVRGDNLSAIARRYGVSVSALQASNNLHGTNIRAGQNLLIPIRDGAALPSTIADGSNALSKVVHRVQRGDTLWSIARRYKVQLKQLVSWNNISTNQILKLNQALLVFVN